MSLDEALGVILSLPVRPRRNREPALKARLQQLARVVARTPEVMVKVTGGGQASAHTQAHLRYLTRNGKHEVENERGEVLTGAAVREEVESWSLDRGRTRSNAGKLTLHVVLSMPVATPAAEMQRAARAFAAQEYANHQYLMVLHTDRDHPHVHVCVNRTGFDLRRLQHGKAQLAAWREVFAEKLREQGIEAEATPRRTRGVVRKARRREIEQIDPRRSMVERAKAVEAAREVLAGQRDKKAWDRAIQERQLLIRRSYREIAAELHAVDNPTARTLAQQVEAFTRQMPVVETEREARRRRAQDLMRDRARER